MRYAGGLGSHQFSVFQCSCRSTVLWCISNMDMKGARLPQLLVLASVLVVGFTTGVIVFQFCPAPAYRVRVGLGLREHDIPPVFAFAPVEESLKMNVEMSSLCLALKDIPELIWIALQDAENRTEVSTELIERCNLHSVNLNPKSLPSLPDSLQPSNSTVFAITPTYKRLSQKVDLTSLCQTLMHVPDFIWIVVEDSKEKTELVSSLLKRCNVRSVHLVAPSQSDHWPTGRGIEQRNYGLEWIRSYCKIVSRIRPCNGVLYFMDDDNKYDLRLFEEVRKTKEISVFPVAFAGGLKVEGPVCKDGKVVEWHAAVVPVRNFPIDMAAFAVNVQKIIERPNVWMGYKPDGSKIGKGKLETSFLEHFADNKMELECRGSESEVLAWHVRVQNPKLYREVTNFNSDVDLQY